MTEQALIKTLGFGSQEFIERAVKGGYSLTDLAHRLGVKNISAVEVGKSYIVVASHQGNRKQLCSFETILLSPAAWKAVGVSRGNKDEMRCTSAKCDAKLCEYAGYWPWNRKMVSFMETLALAEEESSKA